MALAISFRVGIGMFCEKNKQKKNSSKDLVKDIASVYKLYEAITIQPNFTKAFITIMVVINYLCCVFSLKRFSISQSEVKISKL